MKTEKLLKKAQQGDVDAQYRLGLCYHNGEGVKKDYAKAVGSYQKAAEQGCKDGQENLARLHLKGYYYHHHDDVEDEEDEEEDDVDDSDRVYKSACLALEWYRKASDKFAIRTSFDNSFRF